MQKTLRPEIIEFARLPWNYQRLNEAVRPADVIIALGCEGIRVAKRAAPTAELSQEHLINALVGRVQRMKVYGERGYQKTTKVPADVWGACQSLIKQGYNKQCRSR